LSCAVVLALYLVQIGFREVFVFESLLIWFVWIVHLHYLQSLVLAIIRMSLEPGMTAASPKYKSMSTFSVHILVSCNYLSNANKQHEFVVSYAKIDFKVQVAQLSFLTQQVLSLLQLLNRPTLAVLFAVSQLNL